MDGINLSKGERIAITKDKPGLVKLRAELSWDVNKSSGPAFDLDASAAILNANGKLLSKDHFVYFNNKKDPSGSVSSSGDNLTGAGDGADEIISIDLSKLPPDAAQIDFIVNIHDAVARRQNFGQVPKAKIEIKSDADNAVLAHYDLEENFSSETSIHPGSLYKKDGEWSFKAVGAGYTRNLNDFFTAYAA